jgi:hypothetical protein
MKTWLFFFAGIAALAAEIPAGTHLLLRLQNTVNSRTAKVGDYVYLVTATPLAAEGGVVIPLGSHVQGVVALVERAGRLRGRAEMAVRLETLTLPSGRQFRLEPRLASIEGDAGGQQVVDRENRVQQGSTAAKDAGQIAIFAGSGAALGAMVGRVGNGSAVRGASIGAGAGGAVGLATVLLTRGKDVELRQGSTMDVVFDRPVLLD